MEYKFKIGDKVRYINDKPHNLVPMKIKSVVNPGNYLPNGKEINESGQPIYVMEPQSVHFFGIDFYGTESQLMLMENQ